MVDIDAEYERLSKAGVTFFSAPQEMFDMLESVYGRDPDGNIFELQEILREDTGVGIELLPLVVVGRAPDAPARPGRGEPR